MYKKAVKRPFMWCAIIAVIIIFILGSAAAAYLYAQAYIKDTEQALSKRLDMIAADVNACRDMHTESAEYRNGMNVAEAYALIRYYRFMRLGDFKEKEVQIDIGMYNEKQNKYGKITGFSEMLPETTVIFGEPFSRRSSIIVLEDCFTEEQISRIERIIKKGGFSTYIEGVKGYKEGRFFYPTEMEVGTEQGKETVIKAEQKGHSGRLVKEDMQDIQIVSADGRIIGGHQAEINRSDAFRKKQEEALRHLREEAYYTEADPAVRTAQSDSFLMKECTFIQTKPIGRTGYTVNAYAQIYPLNYAVKQLFDFYVWMLMILLLVTFLLISRMNLIIDCRLETEEIRRHMMDSMAHEMKTPLSVIKNYSEVLMEETDEERRLYYTRNIIEEADSMNQAVISLLDFSKMEAGTYPMELSSISIRELARRQADRAGILLERKKLTLELDLQEEGRILADEKLVSSILSNFLTNGICHAPANGKIRLKIESKNGEAYIAVYNGGKPIPEKEMERLWDSFYRDRSVNRESSGVGLAIVRNACLMHNGTYGCRNEEDGVTFWVRIKSMEGAVHKVQNFTGPVIGVTGEAYRMSGLIAAALGILLQSIFAFGCFRSSLGQIALQMEGGEGMMLHIEETAIILSLAGAIMAGIGMRRLYQQHLVKKRAFLPIGASLFGITGLQLWNSTPPGDIGDFVCMFLTAVWVISLAELSVRCFQICIGIAEKERLMQKCRKLRYHRNLYMLLYVLWITAAWLSWQSWSIDSTFSVMNYLFVNIAAAVLPVYLIICCLRARRWFNGRLKAH